MENLIDFLANMPFWYWWVLALGLLVIELSSGSTYFLWPAVAAAIAGLFALSPLGVFWQAQLLAFAAVTIGLSLWQPRALKDWLHRSQTDHFNLNDRAAQKVGKNATVDEAFVNGAGKVRFGDTLWLAEAEGGGGFIEGDIVVITRVEGTKLIVASA
ncbi:MAG: NfeD family protein [Pseudomonadota bacterium]